MSEIPQYLRQQILYCDVGSEENRSNGSRN